MSRARTVEVQGVGPAAMVAAIALLRSGWNVKVLRPRRSARDSPRIDVLGGSALAVLARAGLTGAPLAQAVAPCPGVWSRWCDGVEVQRDHLTSLQGQAWAVDRPELDRLLVDLAVRTGARFGAADAWPSEAATPRLRIVATGAMVRSEGTFGADDRLIALIACGDAGGSTPRDQRLHLEALSEGWAYGLRGPGGRICLGVVTDAQALKTRKPEEFARAAVAATRRIRILAAGLDDAVAFRAVPLVSRWRPIRQGPDTLRLGDAQASLDPLSGRGLWKALRNAESLAAALTGGPEALEALERRSRAEYQAYVSERGWFYAQGASAFGEGFWTRRMPRQGSEHAGRTPSGPPYSGGG